MGCIVCAIRGGEAGRATQDHAIKLARAESRALVFYYVVDTSALELLSTSEAPAVRGELAWLGRVLLRMAQRRAEAAGVAAEIAMGYGPVAPTLEAFVRQERADLFIMGAPRPDTPNDVFADDAAERFAHSLAQATGVVVELVRPDAGVVTIRP